MIRPGDRAPDAELRDDADRPVHLADAWRDGPALVVFYPGDFTPVCTAQLCSYRDRWSDFQARGATVVGVNPAVAARHRAFRERFAFPFPLLSDPDGVCCRAWGAAAWYGTRRLAAVVGRDGVVRAVRATWPFLRPRLDPLLAALESAR